MNKLNVIFFSSGVQEKQLHHYLIEGAKISTYPIEYHLSKNDINRNKTVVILWYTNKNRSIVKKIEEIYKAFPSLPIFLIGENPTKEDLLIALKHKVRNFFTLPLDKSEFQNALLQTIKRHYVLQLGISDKLNQFKARLNKIGANWFQPNRSELNKSFGFIPTNYTSIFFNEKLENGKIYDLNVAFFDDLKITKGNEQLPLLKGRKNKSLLAYLLYNHYKPIHRDILMDKFWSEVSQSSARNSLNVAICSIRKTFATYFENQELILFENDCYCINPELEILSDVEQFNYFWKKGKAIEGSQGLKNALGAYNKALALYAGDFLSRMLYEDWCEVERDNLKETYLFILNRLSTYFYERNEYDACINIGKKMLAKDSCLEEVHRKLIKCYSALGLNDLSIKQYLKCRDILEKELNILPSQITQELYTKIQMGQTV